MEGGERGREKEVGTWTRCVSPYNPVTLTSVPPASSRSSTYDIPSIELVTTNCGQCRMSSCTDKYCGSHYNFEVDYGGYSERNQTQWDPPTLTTERVVLPAWEGLESITPFHVAQPHHGSLYGAVPHEIPQLASSPTSAERSGK
ncbi:hypothetical protein AOLI_G00276620 [Acnodon oligacanthus]